MKHILELPWAATEELKEKYNLKVIKGGYFIYTGVLLPKELRNYKSEDFSFTRWNEDEANAHVSTPEKASKRLQLRDYQVETVLKINKAFQDGKPGFMLCDKRGLGKKLTAIASITEIIKNQAQSDEDNNTRAKILIITSKSNIPTWRNTIRNYPVSTALSRILIIEYSQLSKLLMAPASARVVQKKSAKARITTKSGVPTINWDYVIMDDSHTLKNYQTNPQAKNAVLVSKINKKYKKNNTPFVLYLTATPGTSPTDFTIASKLFSPGIRKGSEIPPEEWGEFLEEEGFAVKKNRNNYVWEPLPNPPKITASDNIKTRYRTNLRQVEERRRNDTNRLVKILRDPNTPFSTTNYDYTKNGNTLTIPFPLELKARGKSLYQENWQVLRTWLNMNPRSTKKNDYNFRVKNFNKKVDYLKVDSIIDMIQELLLVDSNRVYVKLHDKETLEEYTKKFEKKKLSFFSIDSSVEDLQGDNWEDFVNGKERLLLSTELVSVTPSSLTRLKLNPIVIITHIEKLEEFLIEHKAYFDKKRMTVIYLPYFEKTLEEEQIKELDSSLKNGGRVLYGEKQLRETAARRTPPNRIS